MNYDKLVKALRCCAENFGCPIECPRYSPADEGVRACVSRLEKDAAAAIEELDAEETRLLLLTSDLQDKLMDLQAQLPKRGKWIVHTEVKNIYGGICIECPVCRDHFVVLNVSDEKYCRSCGAKMEVQDGANREF